MAGGGGREDGEGRDGAGARDGPSRSKRKAQPLQRPRNEEVAHAPFIPVAAVCTAQQAAVLAAAAAAPSAGPTAPEEKRRRVSRPPPPPPPPVAGAAAMLTTPLLMLSPEQHTQLLAQMQQQQHQQQVLFMHQQQRHQQLALQAGLSGHLLASSSLLAAPSPPSPPPAPPVRQPLATGTAVARQQVRGVHVEPLGKVAVACGAPEAMVEAWARTGYEAHAAAGDPSAVPAGPAVPLGEGPHPAEAVRRKRVYSPWFAAGVEVFYVAATGVPLFRSADVALRAGVSNSALSMFLRRYRGVARPGLVQSSLFHHKMDGADKTRRRGLKAGTYFLTPFACVALGTYYPNLPVAGSGVPFFPVPVP